MLGGTGVAGRYTGCQRRGKPGISAPAAEAPPRASSMPHRLAGADPPMDSFEINKILGAVLGCCLALLSLNIAAGALFTAHAPEKPGYDIVVQKQAAPGEPAAPVVADEPIAKRLASADATRGEQSA